MAPLRPAPLRLSLYSPYCTIPRSQKEVPQRRTRKHKPEQEDAVPGSKEAKTQGRNMLLIALEPGPGTATKYFYDIK